MKMDIYQKGMYRVIKIKEELSVIADLSELKYIVEAYIEKGRRFIAVSFTDSSYIYSGAVAVLVSIHNKLDQSDGELCIIEPNENIKGILKVLNIDNIIKIYDSEDDLPDIGDTRRVLQKIGGEY